MERFRSFEKEMKQARETIESNAKAVSVVECFILISVVYM